MIRILAMAICAILLPSVAWAADCPRAPTLQVSLKTRQDPAVYDNNRTLAQLQTLNINNAVHRQSNQVTMGAAASQLGIEYQMQFQVAQLPDGTYCVAMVKLDATIAFTQNYIYVAKELPPGSCIYREVLTHEKRHFNTDLDLIRDWRTRMEMNIQSAVRHLGQIRAHSSAAGQNTLQQRLQPLIKQQTDALTADRVKRQSQVDSPQEYERISNSCNGEGQKYVLQYLRQRR